MIDRTATPTVLLVDDNPQNLELLEAYMEDLPEVRVVTATNGLEALARVAGEAIRRRVREELAVTVSVGIACGKSIAKVASDAAKPDRPAASGSLCNSPLPTGRRYAIIAPELPHRNHAMALRFTKMHGLGNDYVYVSVFDQTVDAPQALAKLLSNRHTGVGGDGLILICPSEVADARMWMFNADGSEGDMCGNGIRCVAKYVYDHGICAKPAP